MNNNIKISLSIQLQGSTLVRQEVKEVITFTTKKGKTNKKTISSYTLVPKQACLQKNITKEAYDYFISIESCPSVHMRKEWKKMTENERLEYHLASLCKFYHGNNFTYHVFED